MARRNRKDRQTLRKELYISQTEWATLCGVSRSMVSLNELNLRTLYATPEIAEIYVKWTEAEKTFNPDAELTPNEKKMIRDWLEERMELFGILKFPLSRKLQKARTLCLPARKALHFYQLNPHLLNGHANPIFFSISRNAAEAALAKHGPAAHIQDELRLALLNFEENWIREKLQSLGGN